MRYEMVWINLKTVNDMTENNMFPIQPIYIYQISNISNISHQQYHGDQIISNISNITSRSSNPIISNITSTNNIMVIKKPRSFVGGDEELGSSSVRS